MNLLILLSTHALCDWPLQGGWMVKEKYNVFKTQLGTVALLSHALIHALILGTVAKTIGFDFILFYFGVGITHFFIDLGKIKGFYQVITDQILHVLVLIILLNI